MESGVMRSAEGRGMSRLAIAAAFLCCLVASGCTGTVFWPRLQSDNASEADWHARNTVPAKARAYAADELAKLRLFMDSGDDAEIAEEYILTGLAMAGAFELAGRHSSGPVKTL